jgi:hypothetical protein
MTAVSRTDLVTQDMDLMADLIRSLYVGHSGAFRCLDPDGVAARRRLMAETIAFTFGELVASPVTTVYRLIAAEMTALAA